VNGIVQFLGCIIALILSAVLIVLGFFLIATTDFLMAGGTAATTTSSNHPDSTGTDSTGKLVLDLTSAAPRS
jgi:predicted tellurium resistance membrane protein TerC